MSGGSTLATLTPAEKALYTLQPTQKLAFLEHYKKRLNDVYNTDQKRIDFADFTLKYDAEETPVLSYKLLNPAFSERKRKEHQLSLTIPNIRTYDEIRQITSLMINFTMLVFLNPKYLLTSFRGVIGSENNMTYQFASIQIPEQKRQRETIESIPLVGGKFWLTEKNSMGDRQFNVTALFLAIAEINLARLKQAYKKPMTLDSVREEDADFFDPVSFKVIDNPVYLAVDVNAKGEPTQYYDSHMLRKTLDATCGLSPITKRRVSDESILRAPESFNKRLKLFRQTLESGIFKSEFNVEGALLLGDYPLAVPVEMSTRPKYDDSPFELCDFDTPVYRSVGCASESCWGEDESLSGIFDEPLTRGIRDSSSAEDYVDDSDEMPVYRSFNISACLETHSTFKPAKKVEPEKTKDDVVAFTYRGGF